MEKVGDLGRLGISLGKAQRDTEGESEEQGKLQTHLEESAGYSMKIRDYILKIKGLIAWCEMVRQAIGALRHSWPGC